MVDSGTYTPETIARRLEIAKSLLGDPKRPITHWAQGLDELAKGYFGGKMFSDAESAEKGNSEAQTQALAALLGGGSPAAAPEDTPPPAPSASPVSDPSLPRGLRNNNPLNIEAGDFTKSQPGFVGSDGRFARFETPEAGLGAANKLLDTYQNKYGLNTPAGIVGRWAPAADGNNVSAYASAVAQKLGIGPNDPVPPEMRPQLIAAMGQHENGRPIGNVAQALMAQPPAQPQSPDQQPVQMAQAQPATPMQGGNTRAAIVQMLNSPNPAVQRMGRSLATGIIQKQFTEDVPTNDMKELNAVNRERKAAGQAPIGLFEYQKSLKEAGKPVTNINQQQESEFQKEAGKIVAKRYGDMVDDIPAAKQMISDIQTLQELGGQIGTGKEAQIKAALGPYAEAVGLKIEKLGEAQAYEGIVNRLAPNLRVKGSGAQSDFELKNFLKSLPSLGNTPGGNDIISRVMQGLYQNKIKAGEIGSAVLNGEITRSEADKRIRELPDPMQEWRDAQKKNQGGSQPAKVRRFNPATGMIE